MAADPRGIPAIFLAAALGACGPGQAHGEQKLEQQGEPALGLFTTLPILWGEEEDFSAILAAEEQASWVRQALERNYAIEPLDVLTTEQIANLDRLMLAQPRALAAAENVALDDWVRDGGRLLLFADPMLTGHSRYAIGDKRRPQDVVLLSPILARWGLELQYDTAQPGGKRTVEVFGAGVPVDQAGALVPRPTEAPADCTISAEGLLAECRVGEGRVTILADAALLESEDASHGALVESLAAAALDS